MIRWYADNSETRSTANATIPDIQIFGGIAVTEEARSKLLSVVKSAKSTYRRIADFPIKWCFRDLEEYYKENKLQKLYAKLLQDSRTWRTNIFRLISSVDFGIIISIIASYGSSRKTLLETKENVTRFGFSNAMQRVGLFVRDLSLGSSAEVILDWPNKGRRDLFDLEYKSAFHKGISAIDGNDYICGPLKNLGFSDSVLFTGMNQCSLLQISDLIVGATRELVEEALGGRRESFGVSLLKIIRDRFHGAPDNVVGRGISISPRQGEFFGKVKDKIGGLYK